ncbi:helix-turn-helix transcriptional regulator [Agaribacterium sp. ZY112]|uniref:helix-turn-helix transcriptional regulator n=1 Tax=Agaribacterium sp. ZY112 TaxID=3233574 RepID=UPI003524F13A
MKRSSTTSRIERLDILTARLKSDGPTTIGGLAKEVGVSVRTLNRDIQLLKDQGLPIETDAGRGGGVRLDRHWGVGRINLNYSEAVDLLISLAVAEQMNSAIFMAHLTSVRHKLMASFSPTMKHKVSSLKARILISGSASQFMLEEFTSPKKNIVENIHQAFLMHTPIEINYQTLNGDRTKRIIEPHYLLLSYPIWYVIAWDHLRNAARTFRCDRVKHVKLVNDVFTPRPISDFKSSLDGVSAI